MLTTVIGMVRNIIRRAMRVQPTQDGLNGGSNNTAEATIQPQLAKQQRKRKPSVAQSTTLEALSKPEPTTAQPKRGEAGKQRKTPAKGIVQRAKRANKPKR